MNTAPVQDTDCLACATPLMPLGRVPDGAYGRCPACGSVGLLHPPDASALDRLYREIYSGAGHYSSDPERHLLARHRVFAQVADAVVATALPNDGRLVVEVGCGWGGLGLALVERGVPYLGLEVSSKCIDFARARGLEVACSRFEDLEVEKLERVRAFALVAVLEHLPNPVGSLAALRHRLPDDGAVVLQLPTAGTPRVIARLHRTVRPGALLPTCFGSLVAPWHIFLPSVAGMRRMAAAAGLQVTRVTPSRSGRDGGLRGALQFLNEVIARTGFRVAGEAWPLCQAHVFVLRPHSDATATKC